LKARNTHRAEPPPTRKDGFDSIRIPAVETAADGSLVAFAEGRKYNASDPGFGKQDIDLVYKRLVSEDYAAYSDLTRRR
jgi:hypothetical protein